MAFFKARVIKNGLTNKIENDTNVTLEEILLDKDLSTTIRNESDILYGKILENNDKPWFYTILEYALFDQPPPSKYDDLKRNQINHNAANFLENCGRKFFTYFKKDQQNPKILKNTELKNHVIATIDKFTKSEKSDNPMYAGHFQRFFENFLRWEAFNQEEEIIKITPFLIEKCRILAYQQLIMRIISDYNGSIKNDVIYSLITIMLRRSVFAVNYIRNETAPDLMHSSIFNRSKANKKEKIGLNNQPLNLKKEPIPLVDVIFDKSTVVPNLNERDGEVIIPWKTIDSIPNVDDTEISYKAIEDAEMEAYLLIMSIRTSISEQVEIVNFFRDSDEGNNYPLIQALMYCGTRSSIQSLISLEAFRLLNIIFNGSLALEIPSWHNTEEEKSKLDFYNDYANEMIFDPTKLTYKMIHALPVFWNHRYNIKKYKMSNEEKKEVDVSDYYYRIEKKCKVRKGEVSNNPDHQKITRKREPGETALEILQPCLFCDPPISSQLTFTCQDLIIQLLKRRRELKKIKWEDLTKESRDDMVKLDGIILDYYQHHFVFDKNKDATLPELIDDIVPLVPSADEYQSKNSTQRRRASLSGFVVDFFLTMTSPKWNAFFEIDTNPATKMVHCKAFTANNVLAFLDYQECTGFNNLSENTIYNKPIHNDFCFPIKEEEEDDDEIDENAPKRNFVLVDEPPKKKKIKKKKKSKNEDKDKDKDKDKESSKEHESKSSNRKSKPK